MYRFPSAHRAGHFDLALAAGNANIASTAFAFENFIVLSLFEFDAGSLHPGHKFTILLASYVEISGEHAEGNVNQANKGNIV